MNYAFQDHNYLPNRDQRLEYEALGGSGHTELASPNNITPRVTLSRLCPEGYTSGSLPVLTHSSMTISS